VLSSFEAANKRSELDLSNQKAMIYEDSSINECWREASNRLKLEGEPELTEEREVAQGLCNKFPEAKR